MQDDVAARVVILANADDPESRELARRYAQFRGVPADNIVALPLPAGETISWREYAERLHNPLQAELLRRGWLEGTAMDVVDGAGRRQAAVSSHRISYLVVCRGVPLAIAHEPGLDEGRRKAGIRPEFRTNAAAVDSELSLLPMAERDPAGWVPNPLFATVPNPRWPPPVIKVARLDAPTLAQAIGLVEGALEAERNGLRGRAIFDLGGPEAEGDRWLEDTLTVAQTLGFEMEVERTGATLPAETDVGGAALYFGWYAPDANGPFVSAEPRLARGAIAMHLHSLSARSLRRETDAGWAAPLVAKGAAATVGNVAEPYLQLTHRPDLLLRALARGATLGDAAYEALPALGWMGVLVGDPLYRPFPGALRAR